MSEGGQAVSGKYWFHSIVPERTVLAPCDMKTKGEDKNGLPLIKALTEILWGDCNPQPPPPLFQKKNSIYS